MSEYYLGIMCGTSLDSIDVSIVKMENSRLKVMGFEEYKINDNLKKKINKQKKLNKANKKLDYEVSAIISSYIKKILKKYTIKLNQVMGIGFPGITLNHNPKNKTSTYIGAPKEISNLTSIPVVSDFRQTNIKAGGQGAPLTGFFHQYINKQSKKNTSFVNLGGFANITIKSMGKVFSYDTGPANYLIDSWCREKFNISYDKGGKLAQKGEIHLGFLKSMLQDKFFKKKPPKSTGFESFNYNWILKHLKKFNNIKKLDVLATLTYLTISTISCELNKDRGRSKMVYLYGGGAKNLTITDGIKSLTRHKQLKSLGYGITKKNFESVAFAWFTIQRINNKKFQKSKITGVIKSHYLGNIY